MDALVRSRRWSGPAFGEDLHQRLFRQSALVLLALVVGTALVVSVRRATGSLERPLAPTSLFAASLALVLAVTVLRLLAARSFSPQVLRAIDAAATIAVLGTALALSLPSTSRAGLALLWLTLVTSEAVTWIAWRRARRSTLDVPRSGEPLVQPAKDRDHWHEEPEDRTLAEAGLLQQLTRTRTAEGNEVIAGWLSVELAAEQRSATAHVAFCPPFARVPRIEIAVEGEQDARVKVAQVLAYGARFDVKLNAPASEPTVLPLRFTATASE